MPRARGSVLLIEEIGEESYRIDRLLSQLWNSNTLRGVAGLALGAFTDAVPRRVSVEPLPLDEVMSHYLDLTGCPAVAGVRYGHIVAKLTLPLGVMVRLDGTRGELRLRESGVS
jgi:muramoyltetrapeptide carboxypeptidase